MEVRECKLAGAGGGQAGKGSEGPWLGGVGVVAGHPVGRRYREIRALRIYEGAAGVQKIVIAGQVLAGMGGGS